MHDQPSPGPSGGAPRPETVRAYATMNTVRALERLAFAPYSTSELGDALGIGRESARRLLQRLALEGFATAEGGHRRRYRATLRLAALGRQVVDHAALPRLATTTVTGLAAQTGCTAHLWIAGYAERLVCAVHAAPGDAPPCMLAETASALDDAAGGVLMAARRRLRSIAVAAAGDDGWTVAASVLDDGQVVAALAITGGPALDHTGRLARAAATLCQRLAGAGAGAGAGAERR